MSAAEDLCALDVCGQVNLYMKRLSVSILNVISNPREQVHLIQSLFDTCLSDGQSPYP